MDIDAPLGEESKKSGGAARPALPGRHSCTSHPYQLPGLSPGTSRAAAMVEFLIARGALTNLPDEELWATPLAWADRRGHSQIASILRARGAVR
jgi:hypothetical protein